MAERNFIVLERRSVLVVAGADAGAFLQNLISNDVDRVEERRAIYATLLTPQGKFLHDFVVSAHPQAVETELFSAFELPGLEQPLPVPNPPGIPKIIDGTPAGTSPVTGQHSDEILDEMGYGTAAIAGLRRRGVITTWTEQATEQGTA